MAKKVVFLTGTRADFGKIKSILSILQTAKEFETHIFVTGMHLDPKYGETVREIERCGLPNIYKFANHKNNSGPDVILSETVRGFGDFIKCPDRGVSLTPFDHTNIRPVPRHFFI